MAPPDLLILHCVQLFYFKSSSSERVAAVAEFFDSGMRPPFGGELAPEGAKVLDHCGSALKRGRSGFGITVASL